MLLNVSPVVYFRIAICFAMSQEIVDYPSYIRQWFETWYGIKTAIL